MTTGPAGERPAARLGVACGRLGRAVSPAMWQTLFLFATDSVANVIDYLFHAFLGRTLAPGDFAVVQTMNAVFLIVGTAFGVLQPVVARFVARSRSLGEPPARRAAIFQLYLYQSLGLGLALAALAWLGRGPLAGWLNVPVAAIGLAAAAGVAFLARPVVNGMLQGQERFALFGLAHTVYASGRLLTALALVGWLGAAALGGVGAMVTGLFLALVAELLFLGRSVWVRPAPAALAARPLLREGWRLSLAAFFAYAAYMALLNSDIIWTNRTLAPTMAGTYASAAVLRRVMAVLPGAVIIVLFPRIAAQVALGRRPDRTLLKAAAAVTASTTALALVYVAFGPQLVRLLFGANYPQAAGLLGLMAVGMIGAGLLAIALNLFLASRPWPFVVVLTLLAGLQIALLARWGQTAEAATALFAVTIWLGVLAGAAIYGLWLRPSLRGQGEMA